MSAVDGVRLDGCGCCSPPSVEGERYNSPGLSSIEYRLGTHPLFLARMASRIHAWELLTCARCDVAYAGSDRLNRVLEHIASAHPEAANPAELVVARRPLAELGTRSSDDPAIALMDAWAVTADVISFYQERIANEGYLRTATERRSVLSLARAIGYELDPGVAAETYLAFTVDDAPGAPLQTEISAGTQILSIPAGKGEVPQTFETSGALIAHVAWNALRPRLAHPLKLSSGLSRVYLAGTATGVRAGQAALLLVGAAPTVKRVARTSVDNDAGYTVVEFVGGGALPATALPALPVGELDPAQQRLALTRTNVQAQVIQKSWSEKDLQAFLTMHEWPVADFMSHVDDLRATSFADPDQAFFAFREKLSFFGHNAPYYDSLPDLPTQSGGSFTARAMVVEGVASEIAEHPALTPSSGPSKAWQHNWDDEAFSIWEDSLTSAYYTEADAFLERSVAELVGDSWAVFEHLQDAPRAYRISEVAEGSRAGFGMSARVSGLILTHPDGSPVGNSSTDKPSSLHFRRTTASVRSEPVSLAPVPLTAPLPAGTTELRLDGMVLGLAVGQWVALRGEEVESDGALRDEILAIEEISHGGGYTTLHFRSGLTRSYVRGTVTINANVVLASHGETVANEVLGSGDGSSRHQRFTLAKPRLTHRAAVGGSESELEVRVGGVKWEQVGSLYGLDAARRAYVVRIDDDANATVVFGNGRSGATLPTGMENVRATYRSGIGSGGEVGAGSLSLLKTRPYGIRSVTNPLPASGAADPERLDDARSNAPLTVLTLDRVVSLQDYEDYARAYPGIGKARADVVWNGTGEMLNVTVADASGDPVVDPLHGRLLESMELARDPLRPLRLASYQPFVFFVTARVLVDEAYEWPPVEVELQSLLRDAFGFAARSFAQPVTAAEVVQVMHRVAGVLAVDLDELYRTAPDAAPTGTLINTVLEAQPARYDRVTNRILPAELLLIHEFGIALSRLGS